MISGSVVFYKIATTCLLIFAGIAVRRARLLPEATIAVISKYLLLIAMPAYIVFYMPESISYDSLHLYWHYPAVGFVLIAVTDLFALGSARLLARPDQFATFRCLVGWPNWVFMALAVCEPLFGADGIRVVMLFNLGISLYVWSFGMTSFRVGGTVGQIVWKLFFNMQSGSLLVGLALALAFPWLRGLERLTPDQLAVLPWRLGVVVPVWETIFLIGRTALPLSIFQIGLQLGALSSSRGEAGDPRSVILVSALRLLGAPVLTLAALFVVRRLGVPFDLPEFVTANLIYAMPTAVTCLAIVEVYGGAARLSAETILATSIASLATAPIVTWAAQQVYRWG